mmetsp:Transcript_9195/g.10725  ORF Transcript_9195/g.10725 Transcript_9195/m.10725 type:complete len:971 (+) Transcript_9195:158-3070(+)
MNNATITADAAAAGHHPSVPAMYNAMSSQVMGQLMTNPALAAVAAATPLLPPAAMITNPGAFLTIPEYYRSSNVVMNGSPGILLNDSQQQQMNAKTSAAAINSSVVVRPQQVTSGQQSIAAAGTQQQQHGQPRTAAQHQQAPTQLFTIAGMQYPTILPYGVALPNPVLSATPGVNPMAPSSIQVQLATNVPTSQAIAMANTNNGNPITNIIESSSNTSNKTGKTTTTTTTGKRRTKDLSADERAQQNRDRNREHARSTRLRKKAYVSKLKDLVEGLHAERTEEVRQRRVVIQHLAETQDVRRNVVRSFLCFHSSYETDARKWQQLLEDGFWLKQPVTPYRCFRRSEIKNESRITRGVEGMIADASSIAVMIEGVGSRSARWAHIKREDLIVNEEERTGRKRMRMPRNIVQRNNRFRHAISSISASSSNSSNIDSNTGSSGEENNSNNKLHQQQAQSNGTASMEEGTEGGVAKNVSSSSHEEQCSAQISSNASGDFHDYHAKPLPDPKLPADPTVQGSGTAPLRLGNSSQEGFNSGYDTKCISTSSCNGSAAAIKEPSSNGANKRRRIEFNNINIASTTDTKARSEPAGVTAAKASNGFLPTNMIAKKGGIAHSVRPVVSSVSTNKSRNTRLDAGPAVSLPLFSSIGKRSSGFSLIGDSTSTFTPNKSNASSSVSMSITDNANAKEKTKTESGTNFDVNSSRRPQLTNVALEAPIRISNGPPIISRDVETSSSSNSSRNKPQQIRASYHFNEDDMIIMDDVIMCPFVFRTQEAVLCGALAECVMPGMLRGEFSSRNKLLNLEMVYDSMGLMQQLERCSGSELMAQIIPGSLEMALSPAPYECRVITLVEYPYLIVNVNKAWTKLTKYTQMDAEGSELFRILGSSSDSSESPALNPPSDLKDVSKGRCKCTTKFHFDKDGREFVDFMCSYPLTNAKDEVTHILHVSKKLRSLESVESQSDLESDTNGRSPQL